MSADAAIDRFDSFLDDLALDRAGASNDLDPSLLAAVKTLDAAVGRQSPDSAFANQLRHSLVNNPAPALGGHGTVTIAPSRSPRPLRRFALVRRTFLAEGLAIAAIALILIVGLGATGRLMLPSWFGEDEASHLAAPSIPSPSQSSSAILFVVDTSGSMSYDPLGGTSKIEMTKEALRVAVDYLPEGQQVGILVFNDQQQWIAQMMLLDGQATRNEINAAVDGITAAGGTEIFPALSVGFDALRTVDVDMRHIVLLSDGKSRTGSRESYARLIEDALADRTTLSTVAIGDDADQDLLQFLAEQGGGSYHFTASAADIPDAVMMAVRSLTGPPVATPAATPASSG